jgi:hypothetical protein
MMTRDDLSKIQKRNLTIQLEEEIIQAAKELATRRGTSVSGLIAQKVRELVEADQRYELAKRHALDVMFNLRSRRGDGDGEVTSLNWTREDLYDRFKDKDWLAE